MHDRGSPPPLSLKQWRRRNPNPTELSPGLVSLTRGKVLQRTWFSPHRSSDHPWEMLELRPPPVTVWGSQCPGRVSPAEQRAAALKSMHVWRSHLTFGWHLAQWVEQGLWNGTIFICIFSAIQGNDFTPSSTPHHRNRATSLHLSGLMWTERMLSMNLSWMDAVGTADTSLLCPCSLRSAERPRGHLFFLSWHFWIFTQRLWNVPTLVCIGKS